MVTVRPPLAVPPSVTVCKRRLGQSTFCPPARWSISKMKKKNAFDSSNSLPLALRALVWRRERAAGGADTGSAGAAAAPGAGSAGSRAWAPERARGASRAELSCPSHEQPRESMAGAAGASPLTNALGALEESQRQAVLADPAFPLLISAGAGSGKTRVLTFRIAVLLERCAAGPYAAARGHARWHAMHPFAAHPDAARARAASA